MNLSKTKVMIFGNRKKTGQINLAVNGVHVERVSETKLLGVILDDKLNWKPHIDHIKKKVCKCTGVWTLFLFAFCIVHFYFHILVTVKKCGATCI